MELQSTCAMVLLLQGYKRGAPVHKSYRKASVMQRSDYSLQHLREVISEQRLVQQPVLGGNA